MAWATLKLIERFGRYAILALLLAAALVGYAWLRLFDVAPLVGLATAVVVIPLLTASAALALGVIVAPGSRLPRDVLSREEAPKVWALWDDVDPPGRRRRSLAISDDFNASIYERRGLLGLGRHEVMTVGLPLLMVLDEAAVRAIVAHEVGHAKLSHISGGANVGDFIDSFDMLFRFADPDHTFIGGLAMFGLEGALRRLERTRRTMSRQDELAADGYAAAAVRDPMARALVLAAAGDRTLAELVHEPLERELLGAVAPPPSPLSRIAAQLDVIHARGVTEALAEPPPKMTDEAAEDRKRYGSTHPTLEERLQSLGFESPPTITPVARAASTELLPPETLRKWTETFEQRWRRRVARLVGDG